MAEIKMKEINKSGDIITYKTSMELNDGSQKDFIVLAHKKRADFMRDEKGKNMYNVEWEVREWIPYEQYANLKEVFNK